MRIVSLSLRAAALVMTGLAFLLGFTSDFLEATVTADLGEGSTEFAETSTQSAWHQVGILAELGIAAGLVLLAVGTSLFAARHPKRQTVDLMAAGALAGSLVLLGIYVLTVGPSTQGSANLDVSVTPGGPGVFAIILLVTSTLAAVAVGAFPRDDDELDRSVDHLGERSDSVPPTP
ncbi:hypothetical protein [Aeromicrobium stalagmiti]|uniref:hypothetical protein n=1 Tax=Aeromicrobium stalagmiti TaxID=2738988 RepID=UPI0015685144|nr:hypothetical protein [Aeromicrobium stalagmiti]NRQ50477.1 hypothetical protein [Aeromicrobium stalagmiti]